MELVLGVADTTCYISKKCDNKIINNSNLHCTSKNINKQPQVQEPSISIRFENIIYSISSGFCKGKKELLHSISGEFRSGQLIAIIGPSGAGKTTLLDILSGYRTSGIQGSIYTNEEPRNLNELQKLSCYITYDSHLQPLLTVLENMRFAADLKLGFRTTEEEKTKRINEILRILSLDKCAYNRAANLSGGEQKRLSIALELINNPLVMFLDEPTTGLDSFSSSQCLKLLHNLAKRGKTIICTIHQPSASLFQLFDQVYVLAEGNCVYQGTSHSLISFLESINLPCPMYHHPADYVIELACGEYELNKIPTMIEAIQNGKCRKWLDKSHPHLTELKELCTVKTLVQNRKIQQISQLNQFQILLRREFFKSKRDVTLTYMRLIVNVALGLLYGTLYWQTGSHGGKVRDNYNFLFCVLIHHTMSTMMLSILTFPSEMSLLINEHFNRWYSFRTYFLSRTISDIPILILCCVLFTSIVYLMTGQPLECSRILMFGTTNILVVLVVQTFGLLIGSSFNVLHGTFMGFSLSIPMMMLAGFGEAMKDLPVDLSWTSYLSYMRYSFDGVLTAIYGLDRAPLYCPDGEYCHYKHPKKFLKDILIHTEKFWIDVVGLCSIFVVFRIFAFLILKWKVSKIE